MSVLSLLVLMAIDTATAQPGTCYYHNQPLPIPMGAMQGIFSAPKNAVYLFGGQRGPLSNVTNLNKVWKWNLSEPSSGFMEIGTAPYAFYSWTTNAALVNHEVFFIGLQADQFDNDVLVYDLDTESFVTHQRARKPATARSLGGCLASNATHIFMVDGYELFQQQPRPHLHIYDPATDEWHVHVLDEGPATDTQGWWSQYCSVVDGALYVLGGQVDWTRVSDVYRVNLETFYAEKLSPTFSHIYGASVYDDAGDGSSLYMVGGVPYSNDIFSFDLASLSISTAFTSQEQFATAPVVIIDRKMYRFGGERNYVFTDKVEICELPTSNPTKAPTSDPTVSPTSSPTVPPTDDPSSTPTSDPTSTPTGNPTKAPTSDPTMTPTDDPSSTPTSDPTKAPTDNPTDDPTSAPTDNPTVSPTSNPTMTPTSDPTLEPTGSPTLRPSTSNPTVMPSQTETETPPPNTTVSISNVTVPEEESEADQPEASEPHSDEYGVEVTIDIYSAMQPNVTLQLVTLMRGYGVERAAETDACSDVVNVSSDSSLADNAAASTRITLCITTCSQSAEDELFAAIDASEIETLVASNAAEGDFEMQVGITTYHDADSDVDAEVSEAEQHQMPLWPWIVAAVVGFLVLAATCIAVKRLFVFLKRKRIQRIQENVVGHGNDGIPGAVPDVHAGNASPEEAHAHDQQRGVVVELEVVAVPAPALTPSIPPSAQTDSFSFIEMQHPPGQPGHPAGRPVSIYVNSDSVTTTGRETQTQTRKKGEHQEPHEPMFAQLLRTWGFEEFTTVFRDNGWTDVSAWTGQYLTVQHLQDMGLKAGHIATFQRKCSEMNGGLSYNSGAQPVVPAVPVPVMMMRAHAANDSEDLFVDFSARPSQAEGTIATSHWPGANL